MTARPAVGNGGSSPPVSAAAMLPAVRLVTDDDHRLAPAGHGLRHVFRGRPGRQQLDGLRLGAGRAGDLLGRLAGAEQRAREHGIRCDAFSGEATAEIACRSPAVGRQRRSSSGSPCSAFAWRTRYSRMSPASS